MIRGSPAGVNTIFTCYRGSSWMPGASSGTRGVTDGWSRLALSVATAGASVDQAFFYQVRAFFTDGVRPRHPPCACTVAVVEGGAVRYGQSSKPPSDTDPETSRRAARACHAPAARGGRKAGITRSAKSRRLCIVFSCP